MGAVLDPSAEEYLSWLAVEHGRSPNTLAAYRRDLAVYEAMLETTGRRLGDVDTALIEEHLSGLRGRGLSPASVARALSAIRGLHRFRTEEGFASADPSADVESHRRQLRLPKALEEADVVRLVESVDGRDPVSLRDRALLELLYGTGARISEIVGLSLGDASGGGELLRVLGKGNKERLVPVGRAARAALGRWLGPGGRPALEPERWARRGDAEAVFLNQCGGRLTRQGAWGVLKGRAAAVGLENRLHPHVLRHSCATHMLARGADIRVVQELLGHASIATTQVYTKVTLDHLRRAYLAAHPRAGPQPWQ